MGLSLVVVELVPVAQQIDQRIVDLGGRKRTASQAVLQQGVQFLGGQFDRENGVRRGVHRREWRRVGGQAWRARR